MGDSNFENENEQEMSRFKQEQASRGAMVSKVNFQNILQLSQTEQDLLDQIKKFMQAQVDELQAEIEANQKLMLEQASSLNNQSEQDEPEEKAEADIVT